MVWNMRTPCPNTACGLQMNSCCIFYKLVYDAINNIHYLFFFSVCSNISHSALFPLWVRWPSDQPCSCVVLLRWRSEEWRSVAAPLMRFLSNEDLCLNIIARHYCQPDARRQRYARCGARCTQSGLIITLAYSACFYFIHVFMSRCLMLVNRDITTFIANP